ncbi:MAG: hypothetical protein U0271_29355 [Polyangiaceae bacterium]
MRSHRRDLGGEVPTGFARAFGAAGNGSSGSISMATENAAVVRFDLTDPHHPSAPEARPDAYCDGWFGHSGTAQGSLWLVWGTTEPSYHTDGVLQQDLGAPEGEANIDSHGFAVDGVHHYGYIRELESDGEISVATLDNANYVFVYYRSSAAHVVYSSFGPGAKKLLAVSDGLAVVARETTDAKVISFYDVHDAANVVELDAHVTLTGATGALDDLRALAKDDAKVIVADADGALFDVVVGADGPTDPIAPTEVISGADACSGNE